MHFRVTNYTTETSIPFFPIVRKNLENPITLSSCSRLSLFSHSSSHINLQSQESIDSVAYLAGTLRTIMMDI